MRFKKTVIFLLILTLVMSPVLAACTSNVAPDVAPDDYSAACPLYGAETCPAYELPSCVYGVADAGSPGVSTGYIPVASAPRLPYILALGNNWYYSTATGEKDPNIEGVFRPMFNRFLEMFCKQSMTHTPVIIFNCTNAPFPAMMPFGERYYIRLAMSDTKYWAQMIYQLSHEMMHYAFFCSFHCPDIRQLTTMLDTGRTAWNEEIISEAMSLYMLWYMAANWQRSPLAQIDPNYGAVIKYYLDIIYNEVKRYNRPLKRDGAPVNRRDFHARFNRTAYDRPDHMTERNYLFNLFTTVSAETIGEILNMYNYFNRTYRYVCFGTWVNNAANPDFIRRVSAIQPRLQ